MGQDEQQRGDTTLERTVYVAELQCILCGTIAGALEGEQLPLARRGLWRPQGAAPRVVEDWHVMRCGRCGGALFAESIETEIRVTGVVNGAGQARRGRPPKWLLEERRRRAAERR